LDINKEFNKRVKSNNPKLEKLCDVHIHGGIITVYIDKDDHIVLGGFGWYELYDWEEEFDS